MRPSTTRTSATFLLLASTVLCPGAFAQVRSFAASQTLSVQRSLMPADTSRPLVERVKSDIPSPASGAIPSPSSGAKPDGAAKAPGTAATVVNLKTIEGVMGKRVRSRAANEDMGRIVDVLVDGSGQIRAAVIDFGGFLGVGSRKVAVAWKTLDFTDSIQSGSVKATLTRDQVRQSPEYKPDEPIVILEGTSLPKPAGSAPPPEHNQDAPAR